MEYILVRFHTNWADEMDIDGFEVMTKEEWNKNLSILDRHFEKHEFLEIPFGTNESNEDYTKESFLAEFTLKEITEDDFKVFEKLNLLWSGHFPSFENIEEDLQYDWES